MTLVLIIALAVSVVGMVSLLTLKHWELSTGHVVGGRVRPAFGSLAERLLMWGQEVLPQLIQVWAGHLTLLGRRVLHRFAALAVVLTERLLENTLHILRRNTEAPRSDTQASAFLREVSAHKKELLKEVERGAIYEE